MKTLKLTEYYKIINPEYVYLKLTPNNSIRNYNSDKIAKAISSLYMNLRARIRKVDKQRLIYKPSKVVYFMYIEKKRVEFYFIIPKQHLGLIKDKIGDTWKGITITEVDQLPTFSDEAVKYYLTYKNEDALSLAVDRRTNTLLTSSMNVIDVMEEGDKVGILYNFMPTTQFTWRANYDNTMKKLKENKPIDREKFNAAYIGKMLLNLVIAVMSIITDTANDVLGVVANTNVKEDSLVDLLAARLNSKELSSATRNKKEQTVLDTQIAIISESTDKNRKDNNAMAVIQSFKSISEDNELIHKKQKKSFQINDYRWQNTDSIKVSTLECQNFIALPGRELLEQYNFIDKIDTFESQVPEELQQGVMCIGDNTFKGQVTKSYLTEDKDLRNLTLTIIGPTRAGKTKLIANLSNDSIKHGECTILFDFCGNAELSEEVASVINPDKVLNIDCSDFNNLQGLGYNEVTPMNNNVFEVYRCAKAKTSQLMTLINSINSDDGELRARMERYLEAAAVVVFIQDGPIKDVFEILQNHLSRKYYIDNIPENQKDNLKEYILALQELDEWSKATKDTPSEIIGTKLSYVQGILNRVNKLKQNTYMELMLKKDCSNNINLIDEMQKGQLICIKMPEIMFNTETEKDIYATYWLTKIWGALQKRKWDIPEEDKRVKVNIVFDELYQVPNCQEFLRSKLSQIAKFTCKPIISCHYLGQIGIIRDELKAANSSYMLISGCDKDNYKELKDELYPYEVEDLLNLKRYHSLNLIKYEKGWAKFITKLPKPIK